MPVRFRCHGCQRVLSALDRKIGSEVNCPGCGALLVVPAVDTVHAPPRLAAPGPAEAERPEHPSSAAAPAVRPPSPPSPPVAQTADRGGVYVSRRVVYAQAVLLAVAAAGMFVAGYFIGSAGDAPVPAPQGTRSIEVSGRITVRSGDGDAALRGDAASRGDAGAAVLFLPVDRRPRRDAKLEADALNPRRPLPQSGDPLLAAVESLGGAYARTDDAGGFRIALPQPGEYRVLVISNVLAGRLAGDGGTPDRVDLATLGEYVYDAIGLIADRRYALSTRELSDGVRLDYEFRE